MASQPPPIPFSKALKQAMISLSLAVTSMKYLATLARDPNVRIRIYQVYGALEGIDSFFKSSAEHLYSSSTLKKHGNRPSTYLIPYQEVQELLDDSMSRLSDTAENLDQLWQTLEAHHHLKLALKMVAGDVRSIVDKIETALKKARDHQAGGSHTGLRLGS